MLMPGHGMRGHAREHQGRSCDLARGAYISIQGRAHAIFLAPLVMLLALEGAQAFSQTAFRAHIGWKVDTANTRRGMMITPSTGLSLFEIDAKPVGEFRLHSGVSMLERSHTATYDSSVDHTGRKDDRSSPSVLQQTRRAFLAAAALTTATHPATAAPPPPGLESRRGVPGVGGGIDLNVGTLPAAADVIYPSSMCGLWQCQRVLVQVEGDASQAEVVWRALGGSGGDTFTKKKLETYAISFIAAPPGIPSKYEFEGEFLDGVVLDRGFEIKERMQRASTIRWEAGTPNILEYEKQSGGGGKGRGTMDTTELAVVQRAIEMPNEKGFGSNELVRITAAAGGLFGDSKIQRAARVQRRFRRAFDKEGNRVVEGLEIVKTFRVLDGIAGAEMPTSTTKSQIRLSRPPQPS